MSRHFALSAVGRDRPGIVAGVTGALVGLGCNLEDTSMSILAGRFAMVLIVAGPDTLSATRVEEELAPVAGSLGLVLWVHDVEEAVATASPGDSWTLAVHGADRPGMVHDVAAALAEAGVNIVDLSTRVMAGDGPDSAGYAMLVELTLPEGLDGPALSRHLEERAAGWGVAYSLHSSAADIL